MKNLLMVGLSILILLYLPLDVVFGEEILITKSFDINKIIFDGIWTFDTEWKRSSLEQINTKNGPIYIRTAHQDEFVYVMVNVVSDKHPNKGSDKTIICFDTNNSKSQIPDESDFCFMATLGKKTGITMQGGSQLKLSSNFKTIKNHNEFIGIGGVSTNTDRYSKIPHSSYEFKIPTELIGRSDNYGFLVMIVDSDKNITYSWPQNSELDKSAYLKIPGPNTWGNLISPDKSLPEIHLMSIVLVLSTSMVIIFSYKIRIMY